MGCIHCCLKCFERFVRFINRNAFAMMAVKGNNFISQAADAFRIAIRNVFSFALVSGLGYMFMYMGIAVIMLGSIAICYFILELETFKSRISQPMGPLIFIGIISYYIGSLFVEVYSIQTVCILTCFKVDKEISKKTGKPHGNIPAPLRNFFKDKKTEKKKMQSISVSGSFNSADGERNESEDYK